MRGVTTHKARLCMGEMKETYEESGIQFNTSVRYSPESNEVAERTAAGVLTSAVRAMLHYSGFPNSAATYVHNRKPTKALEGCTPYEVLSTVLHLRVFGAPSAIVEPNELPVIKDVFFVGYKYSRGSGGGCRVRDPKLRVVVESRLKTACGRKSGRVLVFHQNKTNPTFASLATTKQINTCSSVLTYVLQLLSSRKHVRRGVYSS